MSFAYTNVADAQQHLQHSVVMYDKRPVWVNEIFDVDGDMVASITNIPTLRNAYNVSIFDPLFCPREVRLGYTNTTGGHAVFLSRVPSRQYKQGICRNNTHIPNTPEGLRVTTFEHLTRMASWSDALRGIYPTFAEAVSLLKNGEGIRSVAFHRDYAAGLDDLGFVRLYHKGEACAFGEDGVFRLPKQFEYLTEELTEMGMKIYGR